MNIFEILLIGGKRCGSLFLVRTILIVALATLPLAAWAEDWKTSDGTVYQDVKVIRVEDDAITIMYKDGGALIPLLKLPPPLQQRFSYDPVKAKMAADVRAKADAENARELQAEIELADKMKRAQQIKDAEARAQAAAAANQNH